MCVCVCICVWKQTTHFEYLKKGLRVFNENDNQSNET